MKTILKHISCFLAACLAVNACTKDDIPDPYQPETLAKINRLDFISGNDSSIFVYDADMIMVSGRDNTVNPKEYEWFTLEYTDSERKQLSGALYRVANDPAAHTTERKVVCSRDNRNMPAQLTREDRAKSFSFSYDAQYRLTQLTVTEAGTVNRYTVAYGERSNVSSVELYQKVADVEGTFRYDFSEYSNLNNPFRFLTNVFYAPVFSSNDGAVFFDKISPSLGLLLSKNCPGKRVEYEKSGSNWIEKGTSAYSYGDAENGYPSSISGNGLSLIIEYK